MAYKPQFGSQKRETLWALETLVAYKAGRGLLPICNLCDKPVSADEPWHESHCPSKPKCFGGKSVGVAHAACNLKDGNRIKSIASKADRVRKKHDGLKGPGLGRHPMRAGRRMAETKTMRGGLQARPERGQKHRDFMARRAIIATPSIAPSDEATP